MKFFKKKNRKFDVLRTDIINMYVERYQYASYLEIGIRKPKNNFKYIKCREKDSVDPSPKSKSKYRITSDEFFIQINKDKKYDIIFIDGLHTGEQVIKDIENSLKHLSEDGTILVHDCNPPTKWHARTYDEFLVEGGDWNGTSYLGFIQFRQQRQDLEIFVVDTDWGVGVIRRGSQQVFEKEINGYEDFDSHRVEVLNLISVEEFKSKFNKSI